MTTVNAKWAWLSLAALIVAWDLLEEDQLTHAFRRAPRPLTCVVCAVVVGHLYGVLPKRYDPIQLALSRNKSVRSRLLYKSLPQPVVGTNYHQPHHHRFFNQNAAALSHDP